MVVKNNDCERNEYVSVCLRKRRIEEHELASILYSVKGII
ncbi:unnamed protein product [Brassica oleracea var. botrytis]